jgi:hypothetical protein
MAEEKNSFTNLLNWFHKAPAPQFAHISRPECAAARGLARFSFTALMLYTETDRQVRKRLPAD